MVLLKRIRRFLLKRILAPELVMISITSLASQLDLMAERRFSE